MKDYITVTSGGTPVLIFTRSISRCSDVTSLNGIRKGCRIVFNDSSSIWIDESFEEFIRLLEESNL